MAISKPLLPYNPGYVEVEVDGKRVYQITESEKERLRLIDENKMLKLQLQAVTERNDFIEDCIAEIAMSVYN